MKVQEVRKKVRRTRRSGRKSEGPRSGRELKGPGVTTFRNRAHGTQQHRTKQPTEHRVGEYLHVRTRNTAARDK